MGAATRRNVMQTIEEEDDEVRRRANSSTSCHSLIATYKRGDRAQQTADGGEESVKDNSGRAWLRW